MRDERRGRAERVQSDQHREREEKKKKLRRDGDFSLVLLHFFFQYSHYPLKNYKSSSGAEFFLFLFFIILFKRTTASQWLRLCPRTHALARTHARTFTQARAQLKSRNIRHRKSVFALNGRPQTLAMYCACAQTPRLLESTFR